MHNERSTQCCRAGKAPAAFLCLRSSPTACIFVAPDDLGRRKGQGAPSRRALQKASPLVGEVPQCAHWGGRGETPRLSERLNLRMPPSVSPYGSTAPPQGGSQGRAHIVRPYTSRRGPKNYQFSIFNSQFLIPNSFVVASSIRPRAASLGPSGQFTFSFASA